MRLDGALKGLVENDVVLLLREHKWPCKNFGPNRITDRGLPAFYLHTFLYVALFLSSKKGGKRLQKLSSRCKWYIWANKIIPTSNSVVNKVIYSVNAYYLMIIQCIINYVAVQEQLFSCRWARSESIIKQTSSLQTTYNPTCPILVCIPFGSLEPPSFSS